MLVRRLISANGQDEARADIHARGFWEQWHFYPNAWSYCHPCISSLYQCHELQKKRDYGDNIREVEKVSFTPLVFTSTGGIGREALVFYHYLADLLSHHSSTPYSHSLA